MKDTRSIATVHRGKPARVRVEINWQEIADKLVNKADRNKYGYTKEIYGAVTVTILGEPARSATR